ncbi:ATP-grasp domain-containing protein [Xenorhabdus thuongxuanensis]|uniref:Carbamoyl-phosphate synthase small chain n=1 Tax=Xenorhabdus thuongxuanensis TaxID=1873484 RepID=A0A1Q5U195_9GAMM|nr:ATP-grasp domain-containing protein [Xenorhabdus thuongxuanensis]OKP06221.1 Carbamoyl-phosphate synthase small chain [Xenorhabdus thuongxuanensis]
MYNINILYIGQVRDAQKKIIQLGYDLTLFSKRIDFATSEEFYEHDINTPYINVVLFSNNADAGEYAQVAKVLHMIRKFDAVICFNDHMQDIAIQISNQLCLPYSISKETLDKCFDKGKMRKALSLRDLNQIKFDIVKNDTELKKSLLTFKYPCIIKPTSSSGSKGVVKLASFHECEKYLNGFYSGLYPLIVEEYIQGKEYSVETVSNGGYHAILAITEKEIDLNTFVEIGHTIPAKITKNTFLKIKNNVSKYLKILGVENGPSHTEIKIHNEEVYIIETHTRVAGDNISKLIEIATGFNIYEICVEEALGKRIIECIPEFPVYKMSASIRYLYYNGETPAVITSLCYKNAFLPGIIEINMHKKSGDIIERLAKSKDRIGYVISKSVNSGQAKRTAYEACCRIEMDYI